MNQKQLDMMFEQATEKALSGPFVKVSEDIVFG